MCEIGHKQLTTIVRMEGKGKDLVRFGSEEITCSQPPTKWAIYTHPSNHLNVKQQTQNSFPRPKSYQQAPGPLIIE